MGFLSVLAEWVSYGIITFATGLLPLFISSQTLLSCLTAFGIGRLFAAGLAHFVSSVFLGTATTFPAGVSALPSSLTPPTLAHIAGILVMLVAERGLSHSTVDASPPGGPEPETVPLQDDMELRELEDTEGLPVTTQSPSTSQTTQCLRPHLRRVYLFTFGLVAGEVGTGISIGYATTALSWNSDTGGLAMPSFDAAVSHFVRLLGKIPTALALTTTLLSASLPIPTCKRHVFAFAAARPVAALLSYNVTKLLQVNTASALFESPLLLALTSFTDGLFVYAALVVRALIANSRTTARSGLLARVFLMAAGALLPWILPMLVTAPVLSSRPAKREKYSSRSHPGLCSVAKNTAAEHQRLGAITRSARAGNHALLFGSAARANKLDGHWCPEWRRVDPNHCHSQNEDESGGERESYSRPS
ncbi:hypothetical protein LXA43DRAFT_1182491 [Ganoderma leucocontextum]|nr:hypothetical protein LXA43DRAFT_1182491 [Ganoderma leucocontextum]